MQSEREEIIELIRQRLRGHRDLLRRRLGGNWPQPDEVNSACQSELPPATVQELEQTDAALCRIREGEFGLCHICGGEIAGERLEVLPFATSCIRCQLAGTPNTPTVDENGAGYTQYES